MGFGVLTPILTPEQKYSLFLRSTFSYIFRHSGIELLYGFLLLVCPKLCIDPLGDLYTGVTEDALCGIYIHAQLKHQRGGAMAKVVRAQRRLTLLVYKTNDRAVFLPCALITTQCH